MYRFKRQPLLKFSKVLSFAFKTPNFSRFGVKLQALIHFKSARMIGAWSPISAGSPLPGLAHAWKNKHRGAYGRKYGRFLVLETLPVNFLLWRYNPFPHPIFTTISMCGGPVLQSEAAIVPPGCLLHWRKSRLLCGCQKLGFLMNSSPNSGTHRPKELTTAWPSALWE